MIFGVAAAILLLPPVMNLGLEIGGSAAMLGVPAEVARRASELSEQNVRVVVYGFFGLVLAGTIDVRYSRHRGV